jgi:hypothetical protein
VGFDGAEEIDLLRGRAVHLHCLGRTRASLSAPVSRLSVVAARRRSGVCRKPAVEATNAAWPIRCRKRGLATRAGFATRVMGGGRWCRAGTGNWTVMPNQSPLAGFERLMGISSGVARMWTQADAAGGPEVDDHHAALFWPARSRG